MATDSLGTLTVDLIANTGGFERGMEKAERSIKSQQKALSSLRSEFDPTLAAYDRLEKKQEQLNRIFKSGSGVIDKEEFDNLSKAINDARAALDSGSLSLNRYGTSAKQIANATRQLPAQFTDIAVSLQAGQNPLTVFLQQGGQIKDSYGGVGAALKGMAGYAAGLINPFTAAAAAVGVLTLAYYQGSGEAEEYEKAIILTGNAAGTTASQLGSMAQNVSKSVGTVGQAASTLAQLAGSGKIASDNFELIATAAIKMQDQAGIAIADTIKQFEKLAQDPVKASKELNEQLNYLTASQYEQIQALVDQGDQLGAASLAEQEYASALSERANDIQKNLGLVETAWDAVANAAKSAWDAVLDIGREDTLEQKLEKLQDRLSQIRNASITPLAVGDNPDLAELAGGVEGAQSEISQALQKFQDDSEKAWRTAMDSQLQKDAISGLEALQKEYEGTASQAEKLQERMEKLNDVRKKNISANSWSDAEEQKYQKTMEALQVAYGEATQPKTKTSRTSAYREDAGTKMLDSLRQQYAAIQAQNQALDDQDRVGDKLGAQAQALAKWEQELADLKSKKTLTTEQQQLLASSDLITAQLKRNAALEKEVSLRKQALEDAQKLSAFQSTLNDQLELARKQQSQNLATFGMSDKEAQRYQDIQSIQEKYLNQQSQLTKQFNAGQIDSDLYSKETEAVQKAMDERVKIQKDGYAQMDEAQKDWDKGVEASLKNYVDNASNYYQQAADAMTSILNSSTTALSDGIYDVLTGAESLSDALGNIAATIGQSIVQALAQMAAQWLVLQAVQAAVGQTGSATALAEAAVTGPAIAAAYAPAAAMVSLASFGANSAPAVAGISAANVAAQSYALLGMAHDGIDAVPETGTWLLQKGERVTTAGTSAKLDATLAQVQAGMSSSNNSKSTVVNFNQYGSSNSREQRANNARAARQIARAVEAAQRYE